MWLGGGDAVVVAPGVVYAAEETAAMHVPPVGMQPFRVAGRNRGVTGRRQWLR